MQKIKTFFLIVSLIGLVLVAHVALAPLLKKNLIQVTLADDDEEDEEDEDEDEDEDDEEDEAVEYETVYEKLPDTVVETTKEVPRYDSDKDGMYDDEDPHPTINEFLIVKDDNQNGIDDRYEQ